MERGSQSFLMSPIFVLLFGTDIYMGIYLLGLLMALVDAVTGLAAVQGGVCISKSHRNTLLACAHCSVFGCCCPTKPLVPRCKHVSRTLAASKRSRTHARPIPPLPAAQPDYRHPNFPSPRVAPPLHATRSLKQRASASRPRRCGR